MAGFYENLNKQNYLKIMNGAYQNYGLDSESINQLNGQGDNITPTISLADEIRNASATAEKATAEENHDDDPSWFQKASSTSQTESATLPWVSRAQSQVQWATISSRRR